jgi:YceI-like domain
MKVIIIFFAMFFTKAVVAQTKLYTKNGRITFTSTTSLQKIEALNTKVLSVWETSSGNIEFSLLIKGFQFEKALMQEHFNENYLESDKYPKATFKGVVENSKNIVLTNDNVINVKVTGVLTIHGVSKQITIPAIIKTIKGEVSATSAFMISLDDYGIKVPAVVSANINKKINIHVNIPSYKQLATQ